MNTSSFAAYASSPDLSQEERLALAGINPTLSQFYSDRFYSVLVGVRTSSRSRPRDPTLEELEAVLPEIKELDLWSAYDEDPNNTIQDLTLLPNGEGLGGQCVC